MDQTALITGASSGIGYELAFIFAREGYNLVLVARSEQKLNEIKSLLEKQYKARVSVIACDLSVFEEVKGLVSQIKKSGIDVDILVNNAGFGDSGFFIETNWEKESQMLDLNIRALTYLTKEFATLMAVRKKGRIMNVASTAAFFPGPLMAVYYATKAYVLSLTEALGNELKDKGISVTALCPGPTASGFQSMAGIEDSKLVKGKKLPTSKEVAEFGYKALMNGKRVAIPGLMNKMQVFMTRLTPRNILTSAVRYMSENA
ncbi:MAG: SDR family oxidoreductase [Bacteroidetes bacterium]|nr:SDR family oxidoreductase [Bacteroidota bacterium]